MQDASIERGGNEDDGPDGLESLVERLDGAARKHEPVTVDDVLDAVGRRSFAPLMLLCGIVMVLPVIGDIPGVPVVMGAIVLLLSAQLLLHHEHVWLPGFLLRRSVASGKVRKAAGWLRRPARFVDRWTRPRFAWAVGHAAVYVIASVCLVIAAATPVMEVVPFSANFAGLAIATLGLALVAHDGFLAIAAIVASIVTFALIAAAFV